MAMPTAPTRDDPSDEPCVVLRGIGWRGYTTLLRLRGEKSSPKMMYLDGDLTLVSSSSPVEFHNIDWRGYLTLLRVRGERSVPKIFYLDGNLQLVSPAQPHELLKKRLGYFVGEVLTGLSIPHVATGQMTLWRRAKRAGVEGDETYYIPSAPLVIGKMIDLKTDPPPDLAIEVVHTNPARRALGFYRRLRVPEVWVGRASGVKIFRLGPNGRYAESENSGVLPSLTATGIGDWTRRPFGDETAWILEVRRWVQATLAPRHHP